MVRLGVGLWFAGAVLLGLLLGGGGALARQQSELPAFPPTDIGVALDQSRSLLTTDPSGVRIEAVRTLVRTLGLYAGAADIRFAMVEFGSPERRRDLPQLAVPLTQVQTASLDWIVSKIQARELPGTDFSSALCLSWMAVTSAKPPSEMDCRIPRAELDKVPLSAPAEGRRRVVILFTDGFPAPGSKKELEFSPSDPGPACKPTPSPASEGHTYMCNLVTLWARLTARVPVDLYMIGLDATNQWWPKTEPYWQTVTGCGDQCSLRVTRVADTEALVDTLMLQGLTPPDSYYELCKAASCEVSPLVSEALFIIRGSSLENRVLKPDGKELVPNTARVSRNQGDSLDIWRVLLPEPGAWRVQSKDRNAVLRVSLIQTPARLTLRTEPERPIAREPFTVTAEVVNPQGDRILPVPPPSTRFGLTLQVTGPSGEQQSREVTGSWYPEIADAPGQYRFEPPLIVDRDGPYSLKAELTIREVRFAVGEMRVEVAKPSPPKLTVTRVPDDKLFLSEQFRLRAEYPVTISEPRPIRFKVTLGDERSNSPIRLDQRFVSPPQVSLILKLTPPCAESSCEIQVGVDFANTQGQSDISFVLPLEWRNRRVLTAQAEGRDGVTLDGEPWSEVSNSVVVETKRPGWSWLSWFWDVFGLGYWFPLLLILGVVSYVDTSFIPPFKPPRRDRYSDLGARPVGRPGNRAPICRLGGTVVWRAWRGFAGNLLYVMAKRWLVVGPLSVRAIPLPAAFWRSQEYCGSSVWQMMRSAVHQCLLGILVKQPGTIQTNGFSSGTPPHFDIGKMAR